jgi:hypothetical protein
LALTSAAFPAAAKCCVSAARVAPPATPGSVSFTHLFSFYFIIIFVPYHTCAEHCADCADPHEGLACMHGKCRAEMKLSHGPCL